MRRLALAAEHSLILPVGGTNANGIVAFSLEDGHTLWHVTGEKASVSTPVLRKLSGTIVRAGDQFVILSDTGELQLATATPQEFKIKQRAQIVGRPTRSYPALADGFAYIKGPRQLVCVDLRGE